MLTLKKFTPYYKYLKPVWWRFLLGIVFGVIFSVTSGAGLPVMAKTVFPILFGNSQDAPEWLRMIVERWFSNDVTGGFLIVCSLALPLIMAVRALTAVGNGYLMTFCGLHVVQSLQVSVFKKIQAMPMAFFHRHKTGELIASIMGYPTQIKTVVVDVSNDLVKQPLILISAIGFLVYESFNSQSFMVATVGLLTVPLVVFPIRKIGIYLAKRSKQLVTEGEALSSTTIESIQSPLEIRAYNLESIQAKRFVDRLATIFRITMKTVRTNLMISPSIEFVSSCGIGLALFLGVRAGMEQEEFFALIIALYMAYSPLKRLGTIHGLLKSLQAPLERLESILGEEDTVPESANPTSLPKSLRGEIEFKQVGFDYLADKPVLRNVSVKIHAGESVALVGKSGAGKTSFVNLIPRFYDITSGSVSIDGIDVRDVKISDLRSRIGYVPQMPMLFNASIADNIRVGREDASEADIVQAAKNANALEFIETLPDGFNTILSERGSSLSGGQRQRIAIARAFLKDAPILILDEATSALDNESDRLIQEALDRLTRDRTTLIIAHRMGTLKNVERRLFFSEGEIVGDGGHEELMTQSPGYRALVEAELHRVD